MAANDVPCCRPMFWVYLIICATLVVFAGLMSGLTLGLMSISRIDLEVLVNAGQPQDRKNAAKILPVMKNQHLLLCTLLICNAMAMEALPIFLDALLPAWGAILISVTLILAFGEIIPQAICSRYGLSVGAKMVGIVRVLMLVFFPISYPISKLLDWLLGKGHFVLFRRAELKSLVNLHAYEAGKGGELTHDETTIIAGALDLTQKTAKDAMTPVSKAFSLDINSKLDMDTMGLIITKGHSRVPIYSGRPTNIIGIILVKNLITCRPEDEIPVGNVTIRKIPRVPENMPLYEILNEFQKGHSHMAVVVKGWKDAKLTMENAKGKSGMLEKKMKLNKNQIEVEEKGSDSHSNLDKELNPAARASPLHNNVINTWRPTLMNTMEQEENCKQLRKLEHGGESIVDVDSNLPSYSSEDEVIGIITMEDVIEELLQEEIYDETDEYVELHNKIRINMLSPRRSSPRSPRIASVPHLAWRTPAASPISPYHHTSILRSPVSPYVLAPGPRPTLSSSPGKCSPNSPAKLTGLGRKSPTSSPNSPANLTSLGPKSPTSHQVSRKPYEKLQKFDVV